jgi:hypothetical protein
MFDIESTKANENEIADTGSFQPNISAVEDQFIMTGIQINNLMISD